MAGLDDSIRPLLRPSDEIKFILECFLLFSSTPDSNDTAKDASESKNSSTTSASPHKRIVAVIVHKDESNGWEEGR